MLAEFLSIQFLHFSKSFAEVAFGKFRCGFFVGIGLDCFFCLRFNPDSVLLGKKLDLEDHFSAVSENGDGSGVIREIVGLEGIFAIGTCPSAGLRDCRHSECSQEKDCFFHDGWERGPR